MSGRLLVSTAVRIRQIEGENIFKPFLLQQQKIMKEFTMVTSPTLKSMISKATIKIKALS